MIKERIVKVGKDYRCPFCPNHEDCYYVIWEGLMETPICDGCALEFEYFFLTPPGDAIWFESSALPMEERVPILEIIAGKSIYDLQLSFVIGDLNKCLAPKYFDEKMQKHTEIWGKDIVKRDIKEERRQWIKNIRHSKKLVRKIMRSQKKIQTGINISSIGQVE